MILTAGTSPAWQRTIVLDRLVPGEVNRAVSVQECAAGKAINVALASRSQGEPSRALVPIGGLSGRLLAADVAALGAEICPVAVHSATRICTTLLSEAGATEIVEPVGSMTADELSLFLEAFRRLSAPEIVVLTGSLATGVPQTLYADLVAAARCPVVLDARGPELRAALPAHPWIVKPSRQELETTLGSTLDNDTDLHDAMRDLARCGAGWVVVSDGGKTLWAYGEGSLFSAEPVRVDAKNPIGSGDCLAGGIAVGLAKGWTVPEAIRLGIAVAAANACTPLPARRTSTELLLRVDGSRTPALVPRFI